MPVEDTPPKVSFIEKYVKTPEPKRINHRIKPCGSLINQLLNAIATEKQKSEEKQSDPPQQTRSTSQNAEMVQALLDTLGSNSQKRNRSAENAKIAEVFNKKSNYDMKIQEEMLNVRQKIHGLESYDLAPNYYEHTKKISLLDGSTMTVDGSVYDKDGDVKVPGYAKIKAKDGKVVYYEDFEHLPLKSQKVKLSNGKTIEVESDSYDDEGHLLVKGMKKIKQRGNKIVYAKDDQCDQLKQIEMTDRRKVFVDCCTYDKQGHLKIKGKRKVLMQDGTVLYYNSPLEDPVSDCHEITLYSGDTITVLTDAFDSEGDPFVLGKKKVRSDDSTVYVSDSTYPDLKSIETIAGETLHLHSHIYDSDGDILVKGKVKVDEGYADATDPWDLKKLHEITLEKGGNVYVETNEYDADGDPVVKGKKKMRKGDKTYYLDKAYYPQLKPVTLTDGKILLVDSSSFDKDNDLRVPGKTKIKSEDGIVMYADFDDPPTDVVQVRLEAGDTIQVLVDSYDQQGDPIVPGKCKVISKDDGEIFYLDDPNLPQLSKVTLMDNSELYLLSKLFDKDGDPFVPGKIKVQIDDDNTIYVDSLGLTIPQELHTITLHDGKSIQVECSSYDSDGDLLVKGKVKYRDADDELIYFTLDQDSLHEITMTD